MVGSFTLQPNINLETSWLSWLGPFPSGWGVWWCGLWSGGPARGGPVVRGGGGHSSSCVVVNQPQYWFIVSRAPISPVAHGEWPIIFPLLIKLLTQSESVSEPADDRTFTVRNIQSENEYYHFCLPCKVIIQQMTTFLSSLLSNNHVDDHTFGFLV